MLFTNKNQSVPITLRDIYKTGVEIGERQNRCHDDSIFLIRTGLQENIFHGQAPGLWPLKMDKP